MPAHVLEVLGKVGDAKALAASTQFGSCVFANKPGDGSAREQAASCQKVLGGFANICYEFATKRYRSNCINWGILPFTLDRDTAFDYQPGDCVFVPGIRKAIEEGREDIPGQVICADGSVHDLLLHVRGLTADEKEILLGGCQRSETGGLLHHWTIPPALRATSLYTREALVPTTFPTTYNERTHYG